MSETAAVIVEFGRRGVLTDEVIAEMRHAPRMVTEVYPGKPLMIAIGGYDEDPRRLWEIPEVVDYIRRYAKASGLSNWRDPLFAALEDESKFLLIKCDAVMQPHPFIPMELER